MGTSGLGSLLVEEGLLTEADRRTIKRACGSTGSAFARSIIAMGLLDEDELAAFLAEKTHWRVAAKELFTESRQDVWGVVDRPLVERLEVLPLKIENGTMHVAMVDPLDHDTIRQLAFFTGLKVHPVISTLTAIRAGLAKLLKDYRPPSSHLEDFLTNHAGSASRLQRLKHKRPRAKKKTAALKTVAKSTKPPVVDAPNDFGDEVLEDESSPSAALEYPDSVNAAEGRATPPPPPAKAAAVAPSGDLDGDDLDLGELESAFEDDEDDSFTTPATALTKSASTDDEATLTGIDDLAASGDGAKEATDADLETLGFGDDALDGDLEGELDLADLDPDADVKPVTKKPPGVDPTPALGPVAIADASEDLDDLARELDADLTDLGDLDADFGDAADPEAPKDSTFETSASPAVAAAPGSDTLDLGELEADLAPAARGDEDLDAILGMGEGDGLDSLDDLDTETLDATSLGEVEPEEAAAPRAESIENDPFAGLEDADLGAPEPLAFDEDPAPPLADARVPASVSLEGQMAALNRALVSMTMASKAESALQRAAPALSGAGLTRGILLVVHGGKVTPISAWDTVGPVVQTKQDGLAAYLTPGLTPALTRLFAGWTEFDAVRDKDLKPFAAWVDTEHKLLAAMIPIDSTRQLAVVTGWHRSTREDQSLKGAALEVFRRLAKKV